MRQYGGLERLEAALVEMGQGMTYPATPDFEPAVLAALEGVKGGWARRLPYPQVLKPRLILIMAVALALLAAAAAGAYYVSVQTWLSAGPRGVQFTNDFELVELFRDDDPRTIYQELAIGPEGKEIYAIRFFGQEEAELSDPQETAIVRMSGLQDEQVQIEVVLKFSDLKDPALWHPDMDLPGIILPELVPPAAINGDLFLMASAWADTQLPEGEFRPEGPPAGTSVIVRHPDGMLQKVLTVRELVDAGLLDAAAPDRLFHRSVVASAPDRLWLQFITLERVEGQPAVVRRMIYEVQDPNGDGDWSDRTVTPLSLPAFVAEEQRPDCCLFMGLVAEPSLGGEDRSHSFLLLMSTPFPEREHLIYRVSDHNSDGDALDEGEFEFLFSGVPASQPPAALVVAPRIVVSEGKVVLRELVISALTTSTRVSRITETGEVIDIARAFDFILDVVADSEGNIYVWAFPPDGGTGPVLYKLKPATEETSGEPGAVTATTTPATGAVTPGVAQIAFARQVFAQDGLQKSEIFVIGVDGSGPVKLVEGEHIQRFGQCPGGSRIFYLSDEEVPNEPFLYVANADGSDPKKVTEEPTDLVRCLSEDSLIRVARGGIAQTLILHDLGSGRETTLLTDVVNWSASPDGRRIAFASGQNLELLDLETGERRRLDGPPPTNRSVQLLDWSADGRRLAYVVGRTREDYDLYVRDVSGGEVKLVHRIEGANDSPLLKLSPSGDWLLVLVDRTTLPEGCDYSTEEGRRRIEEGLCEGVPEFKSDLVLVNVESGEARQVVSSKPVYMVSFYNPFESPWAPNEDSFAYVTGRAAYLESVSGEVRELATAPEGDCALEGAGAESPLCLGSFGWSPDGRYVGLSCTAYGGAFFPNDLRCVGFSIAVLDTTTGEVRTLVEGGCDRVCIQLEPQWWR